MKIMIPDSPQSVKELADSVLATLSASIHWFKIPNDPYGQEVQRRQWALAIRGVGLSEEGVGLAVGHYLSQRWAKDPVPEPRDVFDVPVALLDQWRGGQAGAHHRIKEIKCYLRIVENWRGSDKDTWAHHPHGHYFMRDNTKYEYPGTSWASVMGTPQPDALVPYLNSIGLSELATINENEKDIHNNA